MRLPVPTDGNITNNIFSVLNISEDGKRIVGSFGDDGWKGSKAHRVQSRNEVNARPIVWERTNEQVDPVKVKTYPTVDAASSIGTGNPYNISWPTY